MTAIELVVKCAQAALESKSVGKAVIVGVSGCQGSGKTYTSHGAVSELRRLGLRAIAISIDDYYLDHKSQQELALQGNPLLAKRGLPGTHSVASLLATLRALREGNGANILQYDKSQFSGQGDRAASIHTEPVDVVILEGWMVGFEPREDLDKAYKASPHAQKYSFKDVEQVNTHLKDYLPLWSLFSSLVLLKAQDLSYVYKWRLQQEHAMIKAKGIGMTDSEVVSFVDGYMPAYELYLSTMHPTQVIAFDETRRIITTR